MYDIKREDVGVVGSNVRAGSTVHWAGLPDYTDLVTLEADTSPDKGCHVPFLVSL